MSEQFAYIPLWQRGAVSMCTANCRLKDISTCLRLTVKMPGIPNSQGGLSLSRLRWTSLQHSGCHAGFTGCRVRSHIAAECKAEQQAPYVLLQCKHLMLLAAAGAAQLQATCFCRTLYCLLSHVITTQETLNPVLSYSQVALLVDRGRQM